MEDGWKIHKKTGKIERRIGIGSFVGDDERY